MEVNKPIIRPDPSQMRRGYQRIYGNIVDETGNIIERSRTKTYSSEEEYEADLANYPDYDAEAEQEEYENDLELFHADAPTDSFFRKDKDGNIAGVLFTPIAEYLIDVRHALATMGKKRDVFVYKKGVYTDGEDILRRDIRHLIKGHSSNKILSEIIELVKDFTFAERDTFHVDPHLINVANGILDIRTNELLRHDSKYTFFAKIPVVFDEKADCPVTRKFLSEVLSAEHIPVIQEWYGFMLYREYFVKKALILVGEGDTGKSTLISQFCAFIGEQNVSSISLQKLTKERFSSSALHNKLLNFYDDLSPKDINDNGVFKIATGGGYMAGEKKFKDPFPFKNYAKQAFACNQIPEVRDLSDDAYFLRWIVIQFSNVIDDTKKDTQLIHKLTTPEELSGVLNFALEGLRRLIKNQRFSYEKEIHEIRTEMMRSASTVARFAGDCMEESTGEWISKNDLYQAYADYASRNKIPAMSITTFGKRIQMHAPYIADFKPKDGNRQITAWRNVKLATNPEEQTLPEDEWFDQKPEEPPISTISG